MAERRWQSSSDITKLEEHASGDIARAIALHEVVPPHPNSPVDPWTICAARKGRSPQRISYKLKHNEKYMYEHQ